ncbi:hypothetical protein EON65_16545 [archaeon]|nr:MAG: hypothetical protein EON65_16545 [archaeon]
MLIPFFQNRHIHYGEELTMDYFSITTSDVEWRAAICLCGMTTCRGSFLHYATQDDLQQVLNQNFGPALRYASLLRACTGKSMCKEDVDVLVRHGVQDVAIGCSPPIWIKKYVVDILRFIEYERKALPCALLRRHGASYSFGAADMEARCIMEQRIQSMVCCISMVNKVLSLQSAQVVAVDGNSGSTDYPLVPCSVSEVVQHVWSKFLAIPQLLSTHMLKEKSLESLKGRVAQVIKDVEQVLGQATPVGFHSLREKGIEIREILLTIEDISCSKAR